MPKKINRTLDYYRKALDGITVEEITFPTLDGNPEEFRKFLAYCDDVFRNPYFQQIRKHLMFEQQQKTLLDARDEESWIFGRAVVASVLLWEDIFKKYSDEFQDKFVTKPRKDFNPYSSFEKV